MKNPWKAKSKVNPQVENGHRRIANDVLQALLKQGMTGSEWAVCMAVIDKTYGFQKLSDLISYGQLTVMTNFNRQTVIDAVKSLKLRHILVVNQGRLVNEILFNKHYDTWVVNQGRLVNRRRPPQSTIHDYPSQPRATRTSQPRATHKRKKETLKENYTKESKLVIGYLNEIKGGIGFTYTLRNLSYPLARLKEGHTIEDLKAVIIVKWKDPDFNKKYFRPSTLFNSDKFEGYLMEAMSNKEGGHQESQQGSKYPLFGSPEWKERYPDK